MQAAQQPRPGKRSHRPESSDTNEISSEIDVESQQTHILDLEIEEVLGEVCDELVLDVLGVELGHKAEGHRLHARHVLHKHLHNTTQQFSTTQPHHTTLT